MKHKPQGTPVSVAEIPASGLVDLGLSDYRVTYELQVALAERRKKKEVDDLFLVTEHPAVFTLGRRGGRENLAVSEQFLEDRGIPLVHIERGGDITYHGEGQLVLYPIIHLRQAGLSVSNYVFLLEEVMIKLAEKFDVTAGRDSRNHGVWVLGKKLGSVGIAIRHGVSFHGFALNVNLFLEPFSWVNPCGLKGVEMTSLSKECGQEVTLSMVKDYLKVLLEYLFKRQFYKLQKDHIDGSV